MGFLRTLNAFAAQLRYLRSTQSAPGSESGALEISILTDDKANTLTLIDTGVGMTQEELISNLGTIARSGSKAFMEELEKKGVSASRDSIIGQFGVGFYAAFMVGKRIDVYTRSATDATGNGFMWTSDGTGEYEITSAPDLPVGTKIVIHLQDSCKQFAQQATIEGVVKKYSNFVGFPILLNGKRANQVEPLWMMPKEDIKENQYKEFYRFISGCTRARRVRPRACSPRRARSL